VSGLRRRRALFWALLLALLVLQIPVATAAGAAPNFAPPTPYVTAAQPDTVAAGDLNGDPWPDLAVTNNTSNTLSILLNDGDGTFTVQNQFSGYFPTGIAIGDFDEDGHQDLAVGEDSSRETAVLLNDGTGHFPSERRFASQGQRVLNAVDFDADGHLDVVDENGVSLGDGDGNFGALRVFSFETGFGAAVADFNSDSHLDVAVSHLHRDEVVVFAGDGTGRATRIGALPMSSPDDVKTADLNGDTRADLAITHNRTTLAIFNGDGQGGFGTTNQYPTSIAWTSAIGDLDGDSRPDVVTGRDLRWLDLRINQGQALSGPFAIPAVVSQNAVVGRHVIADFDRDGRADIAVTVGNSSYISVLYATTPASHPRPRGATPMMISLVPAYRPCTAASTTHGAPLAFPACAPPVQSSENVSIGTPDANGAAANSVGSVRFDVRPPDGGVPDVGVVASVTDVRCRGAVDPCLHPNAAAGPDYIGELEATTPLRITDRENGTTPAGGSDSGTVADSALTFTLGCTPTPADSARGSACAIATTANSLVPGMAKDLKRAVWELGQTQVFDGGPDGDVETASGNTLFAVQGVFVP
jgi:hypothetical protein